jgi:class 3 adenylate cyclase
LVVVGDLIGAGASQEQAIVGETPNLAARLQGIADPNAVVIAESTRKLVGNFVRAWTGPQGYLGHGASRGPHSDQLPSRAVSTLCTRLA